MQIVLEVLSLSKLSHEQLSVCFLEAVTNLFQQSQVFASSHHLNDSKAEVVP